MPFRSWVIAVAFGLIAGLGQAQQQTDSPQGEAETQQEPATSYPLPFPVEIIEDQATTDARKGSEEESRQREIEDLVAQQGMNAATQAMNLATQRMADYALYSTILVGLGTVLLVWTLHLTRQANRAAQKAVEVTRDLGEAQTRAYVGYGGVTWISHYDSQDRSKISWRFRFSLKNTGSTPTRGMECRAYVLLSDADRHVNNIPRSILFKPAAMGSNDSIGVAAIDIDGPDLDAAMRGEKVIFFLCEVTYGNAVNPESKHITRIGIKSGAITGNPLLYWHSVENPVNVVFSHVVGLNCTDGECEQQN